MSVYEEELIRLTTKSSKYLKWYLELIRTRKQDRTNKRNFKASTGEVWAEVHHVLPRSIKTNLDIDHENNLVVFTAREHFIAHLLLAKIDFPTNIQRKMLRAFSAMSQWNRRKINSNTFQHLKAQLGALGQSDEHKAKRVESSKDTRSKNPEYYASISRANLSNITPDMHWSKTAENVEDIKHVLSTKAKEREANRSEEYRSQFSKEQSARRSQMKWITNGISTSTIRIGEPLPHGWWYGRTRKQS